MQAPAKSAGEDAPGSKHPRPNDLCTDYSSATELLASAWRVSSARRLLPKAGWSLSRKLAHIRPPSLARLEGNLAPATVLRVSNLSSIVSLYLTGSFGFSAQQPLPLPPTLRQLRLIRFRGRLGSFPAALQKLELYYSTADNQSGDGASAELPLENDMLQEAADIIGAMPADFGSFKTDVPLDAVRGLALPQRLQELSLKPLRVTDVKHTWTLQSHLLPRSLQMLDISGLRIPTDLVLPEGLTVLRILHLRIDDGHGGISLPALPASLESLTMLFQSDASAPQVTLGPLPATLQYLNVHCWASLRDAVGGTVSLGGLPDALQELICTGLQARDAPLLPPGLRRLHLTDTAQALGCLPESLETLELRDHQHPLPPLPPALNDLMLSGCTAPLPLLPASLLSLDVRSTAHLLPPLPCNLRRLELTMYEHQLPDLPPALEALTLRCCGPVFVAPHHSVRLPRSLPEQLRSLALDDYQHTLPPLPPRLQELRLDRWGRPLPPLPEGLKSLYLDRTTHAVTSLPAGLLSLSVQLGYQVGISGVLACALPPGLRLLDITEYYSGTREAGGWRVQPLPPALEALPPALEALTLWLKPQAEEDRLAAPDARVLRVADLPPKLRVLQLNGLAVAAAPQDRLPASLELLYKGKYLTGQVQRLMADDSRICVQRDAFADSRPAFVSFNSTFDRLRVIDCCADEY